MTRPGDVLLDKAATIERCVDAALAESMRRMAGFRNVAVHGYQKLQLPIVVAVIERHLDDFLACSRAMLLRDARAPE